MKKSPYMNFGYLQKLYELALEDLYERYKFFVDIIFIVEISILVEISTINPQLKGQKWVKYDTWGQKIRFFGDFEGYTSNILEKDQNDP